MSLAKTETTRARPATDWRRAALILLCLAGIAVSGYLTWTKLTNTTPQCLGIGGCEEVSASRWGSIIVPVGPAPGIVIPTALLGTAMYVTLLALVLLPLGRLRSLADQAVFGIAFAGVLYSAYLTYIEIFVLRKICPWCVASAVIVTLICILAFPRQAEEADDPG